VKQAQGRGRSNTVVCKRSEEAAECFTQFVTLYVIVRPSFFERLPLEKVCSYDSGSHLRKSLLRDKCCHDGEELIDMTIEVEITVERNHVLQDKLSLRNVPRHVDLGEH